MMDKLMVIASFGSIAGGAYILSMLSVPRKGFMRIIERVCAGIILCWLCQTILGPLGAEVAQSPLAALSAGYLGLPGVAFATFLTAWP